MVRETSPDEIRERLREESLAVVDIRDPNAYADGHIPGSENVPAQTIDASVVQRDWPDEVVVSCYLGKSSKRVAQLLDQHLDSEVSSLRGGFDGWDGPVERGP